MNSARNARPEPKCRTGNPYYWIWCFGGRSQAVPYLDISPLWNLRMDSFSLFPFGVVPGSVVDLAQVQPRGLETPGQQ